MISTTMCCYWFLLCILTMFALPAIHLASAGIVRYRAPSFGRRGHRQPSPSPPSSSPSSSDSSTSHTVPLTSSSFAHSSGEQLITSENSTPPAWSPLIQDSNIEFPNGFKIVGLDENNKPFIIIPNMEHFTENESDILNVLKTALKEAHVNKRSTSSSTQCNFNYQVTVRRTGRCTRFGNIPACLSGDQLYPYARDC